MARTRNDQTTQRLKEIAAHEAAEAKRRLNLRTTAARRFGAAAARLAEARTAWEAAQGETTEAKASAVADLLDTGMTTTDVSQLLGIDTKQLRALRAAAPTSDTGDTPKATEDTLPADDDNHLDASRLAS